MPRICTLKKEKEFAYSGSVSTGATLLFTGRPYISPEFFRAILHQFNGKTIPGGFSMTDPTPGGLGQWVAENSGRLNGVNLTPRHCSFIAAILVHEGLIVHSSKGNAVFLDFRPRDLPTNNMDSSRRLKAADDSIVRLSKEPSVILDDLLKDVDEILRRITTSHLQRYDTLQTDLLKKNIDSDLGYQCLFNGFYRMQRRTKEWYRYYFSMLQREKHNKSITFKQVIEQIYADKHRVEPAFSSKLVATICPEMPVYDKHVRENLSLKVPPQYSPAKDRVQKFIMAYATLDGKVATLIRDPIFTTKLRPAFDRKFPAYAHFTDVKKLDLLLWQYRKAKQNA